MARARIEPKQRNTPKSISFDPNLLKAARVRAAQMDMSFSQYICELVQTDLGGKKKAA